MKADNEPTMNVVSDESTLNINDESENKPAVLETNLTSENTNMKDDTENKQPDVLEVTSEVLNCLSESDDEFLEPNQFLPGEGLLTLN